MDEDNDLLGILHRAKQVECPACGAKQSEDNEVCDECHAAMPDLDDPAWEAVDEQSLDAAPEKVPLERTRNYRLLRSAAAGAVLGTMSDEDYRMIMVKLKYVGDTGVRVCDADVFKQKFVDEPPAVQQKAATLRQAFVNIAAGIRRMEVYLNTHSHDDVKEGYAVAKAGFIMLDEVKDAAPS